MHVSGPAGPPWEEKQLQTHSLFLSLPGREAGGTKEKGQAAHVPSIFLSHNKKDASNGKGQSYVKRLKSSENKAMQRTCARGSGDFCLAWAGLSFISVQNGTCKSSPLCW